jgi:hypothetical protein
MLSQESSKKGGTKKEGQFLNNKIKLGGFQ